MTYLEFHLIFMLPALTVAGLAARGSRERLGPRVFWSIPVLAVLALLWTTAWDNYLVARGVWSYGAERVLGTIGWVPIEEYAFFLLQPLLTSWTLCALMKRGTPSAAVTSGRTVRLLGLAGWMVVTAAGLVALRTTRGTYLGLILIWAAPVAGVQWAFAAAAIRRRAAEFAAAVLGVTLYLCVADAVAIRSGIWTIQPATSTGLTLLGLPIEEAIFFFITNILIAQGLLLFLDPPERLTR
jgi:lycopene cyclase domain-containing protein